MYTIYWMNSRNQDWTESILYTEEQAKEVLKSQGYQLSGDWYTRKQIGWEGDTKAKICKMTIYQG